MPYLVIKMISDPCKANGYLGACPVFQTLEQAVEWSTSTGEITEIIAINTSALSSFSPEKTQDNSNQYATAMLPEGVMEFTHKHLTQSQFNIDIDKDLHDKKLCNPLMCTQGIHIVDQETFNSMIQKGISKGNICGEHGWEKPE